MLNIQWSNVWTEQELYNLQVQAVTDFMKCNSQHSVEATVELAGFLNHKGLNADNYPIFLELLREENYHVIEALLGDKEPFDFFSKVEPNPYLIDFCFQMLRSYAPGGVHDKTLSILFGIIYRNYHRAR
ncbi:MAG: hypothetical protein ACOC7U_07185 [Spirochaetota bacterium]